MKYPAEFSERMRALLGGRYGEFAACADNPPYRALRINPLKCGEKAFSALTAGRQRSPFCPDAYYIDEGERLGGHPYHHAGAFYLQEPSAGAAVEMMQIDPGDRVLDLCAAPGGKATQIAGKLGGKGLLWCNETVAARTGALLSNLERSGVPNCVVTSRPCRALADALPAFFDKILVDAPCSGEGMMRKEPAAVSGWSTANIAACAKRQAEILSCAADMLLPGGLLCYSTCTFAPEENEEQIARFLTARHDFSPVKIDAPFGQSGFAVNGRPADNMLRIFPFQGGEGHFIALLKKRGSRNPVSLPPREKRNIPTEDGAKIPAFRDFWRETFTGEVPEVAEINGEIFLPAAGGAAFASRVLRNGVPAGFVRKGRFEPAHALFACPFRTPQRTVALELNDPRVTAYLHGEEIMCSPELAGYCRVSVDGIPLGFGKAVRGVLKNRYPKGLRIMQGNTA